MNIKEIWKVIVNEPNYEVSNLGRIRNINNKKIKNFSYDKDKYLLVSLNGTSYRVHRLVAFAFVNNPNPKLFNLVNHKDENKQNNVYTNLEWCDNKYNVNYGNNINKIANSLSKEKVIEYDVNGNIINIYRSLSYVAHKIAHGNAICDALFYNYYNRFYDGKYYFLETEIFDNKRKVSKRVYCVYHKEDLNVVLCRGDRRVISKYLKLSVKQVANYINYYNSKNRKIQILDYIIKIELV